MQFSRSDAVVIATYNKAKAGEMFTIIRERFHSIPILTLEDFRGAPEPEEDGATYCDNATIKAESAVKFTQQWCIADDAGLEIDALDGAPGVHSRRFEGKGTPFPEKMAIILDRMKDVPDEKRGARFVCCVALACLDKPVQLFDATCEGSIAREPRGSGGFGYDPIFFLPELGCTMAELTPQQKHAISHRGKVLKLLGDHLEACMKGDHT
jgi:XTP/dITP diphosphohydrolase